MHDMNPAHPVFRLLPARLHPYARLARLDRPIGTWLLLLPCWWGQVLAAGSIFKISLSQFTLFAMGAILMRSAGCVVNDLWDQDLDAQVERTRMRPLPAGEITRRQAFHFLALLLAPSFLILLCLGKLAILLGILSLALVAAYPLMKRLTWWPQLFLGFTFNWGILLAWAAVQGALPLAAFVLYAAGILWTLAYDTIYAHQDIEDDMRAGIKSTALLFGENSKTAVKVFFAAAIVFIVMAKLMSTASPLLFLFTAPLIAHAVWQMRKWDPRSPASSLQIFKSNAVFGGLVLLMLSL